MFSGSFAFAVAVDTSGAFYVTGATNSAGFPITPNAFDRTPPVTGGPPTSTPYDVFLTKFRPAGTALDYSTFIGGIGEELATGIAVDGSGAAYISGWTGDGALSFADTLRYPMTNNSQASASRSTSMRRISTKPVSSLRSPRTPITR